MTTYKWTVRRYGAHPRNQIANEHMLALVEAPDWETACIAISFLASILLVPLAYGLALDLHGSRAARIAGLTVAMWPWLVDYAGRVGPDALGCTLWFASVWLLARGMRRGGVYSIGAAATFVALAFTRAEGVFLLPAALVAAVAFLRPRDRADVSRLGRFAVVAVILLFLCAAAFTHVLGHAPMGYRVIRIVQDWGVTPFEVARMRAGDTTPKAVIAHSVLIPFARTTFKTLFDVLPIMLGPVLMTFLGVGLLSAWRSASHPRNLPLEGFVLALAAAPSGPSR
jgi:4-amino-4-deoxy-L-arabinose transferase-like glycosyltransferase